MTHRLLVLLAGALLAGCARSIAPIDPGDGEVQSRDAASDDGRTVPADVPHDVGPVPCSEHLHDGDHCATTHDVCILNVACGTQISCDCGSDGLWHCADQTPCDAGP